MLQIALLANSVFAFAFDNISSPSSFWDLWMNFASRPCEPTELPAVIGSTATGRNRPIVYM